jgi:hypothetical protein
MFGLGTDVIFYDILWFLVVAGWVLLIMIGLEADKPLSGGLPGHMSADEANADQHWTARDQLGVIGSWLVFSVAAASLPIILWWIFAVHEPMG